jgi:hypothetical protein
VHDELLKSFLDEVLCGSRPCFEQVFEHGRVSAVCTFPTHRAWYKKFS